MKKSKKSSEEAEDRLSELPDSLIYEIFGLLPMRDVVRTTLLSKRWNKLWTTTPYLEFDGELELFNRALILWRGSKILKFKCYYSSYDNESVFSDIDLWVRLAKENGVEELYLEDSDNIGELYCARDLHSCSSLRVLSLKGCNFQIHGNANVQWNQLKSLSIGGHFLNQNLINKVISGSPRLEDLSLTLEDLYDNLSIRSTSLKVLWIKRALSLWYDDYDDEPSTDSELRIWAPNLETLHFRGDPCPKYSLMNVSSLTHLTLDLFCNDFFGEEFLRGILVNILSSIQHVEKLTMSTSCPKELVAMKEKYLLSPLSNFNFLSITESDVYFKDIVDLLQIFPKLETLVIESSYKPKDFELEFEKHDVSFFLQVERNLPKSFGLQLRTVQITLRHVNDMIFPFMELLLKHASKLQKMLIRVSKINRPSMPWFLEAQQKVLRMPRSSPTAELIFAEY